MPFQVLTLLLTLTPARALTHAREIGSTLQSCVEGELARRAVRVTTPRMRCTGAALDARVVRFAGHCFAPGTTLGGIYDADWKSLAEDGRIRREGGHRWSASFDEPDQAEVVTEAPVADVGPIAMADVEHLPAENHVVIAGFGFSHVQGPLWKLPWLEQKLRYAWGHVDRIESRVPGHRGKFAYRFTPEDPRSSSTSGDDGAPAFLVEGCRLKYIGTVTGRKIPLLGGSRTIWLRPHTDLASQ